MKKIILTLLLAGSTLLCGNYEKNLNERMAAVEKRYEKFTENSDYTSVDHIIVTSETLTAWNKEINTIYQLLMKKLPKEEQEKLRDRQRAWIKERDEAANKAVELNGTAAYEPTRLDVIYIYTKNRAIELARMYDVFN